MNRDNMQKWIEALRSGKYEQGTGSLCTDNKYCCLGVACEVAIENGVEVAKEDFGVDTNLKAYDGERSYMPLSVSRWLGLDTSSRLSEKNLVDMNDVFRMSFAEIANRIERSIS